MAGFAMELCVAADVGVLILNKSGVGGLSSGPNCSSGNGSSADSAFAAVSRVYATGNYSFGHEIGHLLWARHDNDGSLTPYAYGHGYKYTGSPSFRTIMAVDCSGCPPRVNYWSNPLVKLPGTNVAMGTPERNDNARVLNTRKWMVYAYR
jgi:hypothetical protein